MTSIPRYLPLIAMINQVDAFAITKHEAELAAPKHCLTPASNLFIQKLNAMDLSKGRDRQTNSRSNGNGDLIRLRSAALEPAPEQART